jgi:hypothetical protein
MAGQYGVDLSTVRDQTYGEWKKMVKLAVSLAANQEVSAELAKRGYPDFVSTPDPRPYVRFGGVLGRFGVQWRWSTLRTHDPRFLDPNSVEFAQLFVDEQAHSAEYQTHDAHVLNPDTGLPAVIADQEPSTLCQSCGRTHGPEAQSLDEMVNCAFLVPPEHKKTHFEAMKALALELTGISDGLPGESIYSPDQCPAWLRPHLKLCLEYLRWPNQTREVTYQVLQMLQRLIQFWARRKQRSQAIERLK